MFFALIDVFKGADFLIYPLGLCSIVMVFILGERSYALRRAAVMPQDLVDAVVGGKPITGGQHSVLARIIDLRNAIRETKERSRRLPGWN